MLEVNNLFKNYGSYTAVKGISFTVSDGEILGFLGPNGAGKSTTMNIITGYLSPSEGTVKVAGFDIIKDAYKAKSKIGYLPENPPLYQDMTVDEYLKFVCRLKKVKKSEIQNMIEDVKDKVKISHVSEKLIKNLSKGYKQRVGIAQAIIGNPEIIILDEPTSGLDPKQIIDIRNVIKSLGKNHTVILSSHILSEVQEICDRVMIINNGKIVAQDTTERLSDTLSKTHKLRVCLKGDIDIIEKALEKEEKIINIERQEDKEEGSFDFILETDENCDLREILFDNAMSNGYKILVIKTVEMSLEEIFMEVTNSDFECDEENKEEEVSDEKNSEDAENEEKTENISSDEKKESDL